VRRELPNFLQSMESRLHCVGKTVMGIENHHQQIKMSLKRTNHHQTIKEEAMSLKIQYITNYKNL
jgi:hypothetical protein